MFFFCRHSLTKSSGSSSGSSQAQTGSKAPGQSSQGKHVTLSESKLHWYTHYCPLVAATLSPMCSCPPVAGTLKMHNLWLPSGGRDSYIIIICGASICSSDINWPWNGNQDLYWNECTLNISFDNQTGLELIMVLGYHSISCWDLKTTPAIYCLVKAVYGVVSNKRCYTDCLE